MRSILIFSLLCLISSCSTKKNLQQLDVVRDFGAKPDGRTDNTLLFQKAINQCKGELVIPKGNYIISKELLINKNNFKIVGNGAVLKMKDGTITKHDGMLKIDASKNVIIENLTLNANRQKRKPAEVPAQTLKIFSSSHIQLKNISCTNNVCDGFYISSNNPKSKEFLPTAIDLIDCKANNSFRNGLSIILGTNITIQGGSYNNSNGTNPQAGIDVEANRGVHYIGLQNIRIENVETKNNIGYGIMLTEPAQAEKITVSNCIIQNNKRGGIRVGSANCKIIGNKISHSDGQGIYSIRYEKKQIDNNIIDNNEIDNCAIGIEYLGFNGQILNNTITRTKKAGIILSGKTKDQTKVKVINNSLENIGTNGIDILYFQDAYLNNNTIKKTGKVGIYILKGKVNIEKNTIDGCNSYGIHGNGSTSIISGNSILRSTNNAILISGKTDQPKTEIINNVIQQTKKIKEAVVLVKAGTIEKLEYNEIKSEHDLSISLQKQPKSIKGNKVKNIRVNNKKINQ